MAASFFVGFKGFFVTTRWAFPRFTAFCIGVVRCNSLYLKTTPCLDTIIDNHLMPIILFVAL